jgi:hypothetical protein
LFGLGGAIHIYAGRSQTLLKRLQFFFV